MARLHEFDEDQEFSASEMMLLAGLSRRRAAGQTGRWRPGSRRMLRPSCC